MKFFIKHARKIQLFLLLSCLTLSFLWYAFVNPSITPFVLSFLITIAFNLIGNFIVSFSAKKKCLRFQSSCDPTEYLDFIETLYRRSPKNLLYTIDYCSMLVISDSSNYQLAKNILENFDLTPFSKKIFYPIVASYYNNLCDVYMFLDEIEEAQKAYEKMLAIFSTPEAKEGFKPHLFSTLALTTAEIYIKKGDYETALTEIGRHETPDLFEAIKHALTLGKIYISTNETAKAKEQLEYVIENGRKLSTSKEASKLLEEIS